MPLSAIEAQSALLVSPLLLIKTHLAAQIQHIFLYLHKHHTSLREIASTQCLTKLKVRS